MPNFRKISLEILFLARGNFFWNSKICDMSDYSHVWFKCEDCSNFLQFITTVAWKTFQNKYFSIKACMYSILTDIWCWKCKSTYEVYKFSAGIIYLFKFNNSNTRTRCDLCSKLATKTRNVIDVFLLSSLLLTSNIFQILFPTGWILFCDMHGRVVFEKKFPGDSANLTHKEITKQWTQT